MPPPVSVLTDEPYNVKVAGNVTRGDHREFAMASGEMTDAEFLAFNGAWIATVLPYLCEGGILGTFIDWRGLPTVHSAATKLGLVPLNLIVWTKTNAGMGSLHARGMNFCPCSPKGAARTSTMSNWADAVGGARTSGPILAPRPLAPMPAGDSKTIRRSSPPLCSRTPSSTSPIAAILSSTHSLAPARPSSPPRPLAASAEASNLIRFMRRRT
jgi:hypothetical protein